MDPPPAQLWIIEDPDDSSGTAPQIFNDEVPLGCIGTASTASIAFTLVVEEQTPGGDVPVGGGGGTSTAGAAPTWSANVSPTAPATTWPTANVCQIRLVVGANTEDFTLVNFVASE